MLALLPVCVKENQEERLACMRALLLAADFGVLPAANSPSLDFMLWLTACRPNVRDETRFCNSYFKSYFKILVISLFYLYVYLFT